MTKEQAIEILKCFKDNEIQRDKLEIDNRCGGWKIGRIYKSLELNTAIETVLSMLEEKDEIIKNIIKRLDNDIKRITETKAESCTDDYRRCRLKAYRTKTKEIKEYIEEQYFENKSKELLNK